MSSRYLTIPTEKTNDGKIIYRQIYYPSIGESEDDIYIITSSQDRLDLIAYDFWGNESYWWILVIVNNLEGDSMFPPIGIQLRIPKSTENIINKFLQENEI
jgi:hypothetical protein